MKIYYYLTLFPMEALIASQLKPEFFGSYMAIGSRKGSAEQLVFLEVNSELLGGDFDLDYARKHCIEHSNGNPKNSVYLSVYQVLEKIPLSAMGTVWLTSKDGRSLPLESEIYTESNRKNDYALYQELCPVHPLVATTLNPKDFTDYMTGEKNKISMPAICFADLVVPDLNGGSYTGNVGGYFNKMMEHLTSCINDLQAGKGKRSKVVDRSSGMSFNYQVLGRGIYIGNRSDSILFYPMLSREELKKDYYDWGKSTYIF